MTGHRPFRELTRTFTPERRARVAAKAARLRETMTLEELRKALELSYQTWPRLSQWASPPWRSSKSAPTCMCSNLRRYIEALGGTLEITARFPDASVVLTNIGEGPP